MKPYDPAAKCPKCGYAVVSVYFYPYLSGWDYRVPLNGEVMQRRCSRCGYGWLEACLKAPEEK